MTPASLGLRIAGGLIDLLITIALFVVFGILFGESSAGDGEASLYVEGWPFVGFLALWFAYFWATETAWGASIGKRAIGLRVVGEDGQPVGAGRIAIRTAVRLVDGILFYVVGMVAVAVSPRNQRLGDMAARTIVVAR